MDYSTYLSGNYKYEKVRYLPITPQDSKEKKEKILKHNKELTGAVDTLSEERLYNSFITEPLVDFIKRYNIEPIYKEFVDEMLSTNAMYNYGIPDISGGYWRRALQGEKFEEYSNDIDIFCYDYNYQHFFIKNMLADTYGDKDIKDRPFRINVEGLNTNLLNQKSNNFFSDSALSDVLDVLDAKYRAGVILHVDELGYKKKVQLVHHYFSIPSYKLMSVYRFLARFDNYSAMFTYNYMTENISYHVESVNKALAKEYDFNICSVNHPVLVQQRLLKFAAEGWTISNDTVKNVLQWLSQSDIHTIHSKIHYEL